MKNVLKKTVCAILVACICASILLLSSCADGDISLEKATKLVGRAEKYLSENSYNVTVSVMNTSTSSAVQSEAASVMLTVDGENYSCTESRGEKNITFLFVDDVFYVNESFIGIITKEPMTGTSAEIAEEKAENYERYIGSYLQDIKLSDYEHFEKITANDGSVTLVCAPLSKAVADASGKEFEEAILADRTIEDMYIDRDRSSLTIKLDAEGRFTSIKKVNSVAVVYKDGASELVTNTNERNYTYQNSELETPADADNYIGMNGGYKDLFGGSAFEVTTKVNADSTMDSTTQSILQNFFGTTDNTLKVDGNYYHYVYDYSDTSSGYGQKYEELLHGDKLYLSDSITYDEETSTDLAYIKVTDENFDYYYYQRVIAAYVPSLARNYNVVKVSTEGKNTKVECEVLEEEYFFNIYKSLNEYSYSQYLIIPKENNCSYTVVFDENGRYLSTELFMTFGLYTKEDTQTPVTTHTFKITRTFDYTEADAFYKDAEKGDSWIKAPENAADYSEYSYNY